jgi:AP-1 complex subunit gamma-1
LADFHTFFFNKFGFSLFLKKSCFFFFQIVPNLVRILKNLILAGYSPDHDVSGVSDPFLQVKILKLLRVLGRNDADASEAMNDILAQVATNTETSKNVGNTILYETVLSIMDIKSEGGLRVLAVNILGRFLLNNDKNIRYVALNTLLRTVHVDTSAVQRHRSTILECLKDPDISIRKRAMELSFALVNSQNIRTMMKELITFLEKADPEFKAHCSSNIVMSAERFSPNKRWHLDTLLKVLVGAGNYVRDDVISSTIQLISESTNQQPYMTLQLYKALSEDLMDKQPLTQVAVWAIGEYGDQLLQVSIDDDSGVVPPTEEQVIDLYQKLLWSPQNTTTTKQYALMSLTKLSTRFTSTNNKIQQIISSFCSSLHIELQQRGVEFSQFFGKYSHLRPSLLERMPPMEIVRQSGEPQTNGDIESEVKSPEESPQHVNSDSNALLDLLVDFGGTTTTPQPVSTTTTTSNKVDLLDLFNEMDNIDTPALQSLPVTDSTNLGLIVENNNGSLPLVINQNSNFIGGDLLSNTKAVNEKDVPIITAYDKDGLNMCFSLDKVPDSNTLTINAVATNQTLSTMTDFLFQAAVPKTFQLQMMSPSGTIMGPNGQITQVLRVTNPNKSTLKMRIRLSYTIDGNPVQVQTEVNNFPTEIWD